MPTFADQFGVREEASILSQPVLLPDVSDRHIAHTCLSNGINLLNNAHKPLTF